MCTGLTLSSLTVSCCSEKKTKNKKTRFVIMSCSFYISLDALIMFVGYSSMEQPNIG